MKRSESPEAGKQGNAAPEASPVKKRAQIADCGTDEATDGLAHSAGSNSNYQDGSNIQVDRQQAIISQLGLQRAGRRRQEEANQKEKTAKHAKKQTSLDATAEEDSDAKLPATQPPITRGEVAAATKQMKPAPLPQLDDPLLAQTFPERLMEMLDKEVVPDAMWWAEQGKCFAIDLSRFEDVLHRHFQATKYASFTRKLNKWGFRKINNIDPETPDSVVLYRHDLFQKGQPTLLKRMSTKRKREKNTKDDKRSEAEHSIEQAKGVSEEIDDRVERQVDAEDERVESSQAEIQEEKTYESLAPCPQRLTQHYLRSFQEGGSRGEGPSSSNIWQQMQQQFSIASSLARNRITNERNRGPDTLAGVVSAAGLPAAGLSTSALQRRPPENIASPDPDPRQLLLDSLLTQQASESEQQQQQRQLEMTLLRQQQEHLAGEVLVQRRLAASNTRSSHARLPFASSSLSLPLEGSHSAFQESALQGIRQLTSATASRAVPSSSHSSNNLPSALPLATLSSQRNLSDIAAALQPQQSQSQAVNLAALNPSELQAALEARSAPPDIGSASALQLMSNQPLAAQGRTSNSSLLEFLLSRSNQSSVPSAVDSSRSIPGVLLQRQVQLRQQQQEQERQLAATAVAQTTNNPTRLLATLATNNNPTRSTEQQLLEALLERQRLQEELMREQ